MSFAERLNEGTKDDGVDIIVECESHYLRGD